MADTLTRDAVIAMLCKRKPLETFWLANTVENHKVIARVRTKLHELRQKDPAVFNIRYCAQDAQRLLVWKEEN